MSAAFDIDNIAAQEIADLADVDVRTVARKLAGLPVRGRTGNRIDRAMQALGVRPKAYVMDPQASVQPSRRSGADTQ